MQPGGRQSAAIRSDQIGLTVTPNDLRRWQAEMNLTYTTAAQALGVGRQTYSNWLSGRSPIPGPVDLACAALVERLVPYSARDIASSD